MEFISDFFDYVMNNWSHLASLTLDHILMVIIGLALALMVGIPLGIICFKNEKLAKVILATASIIQVFPSIALLGVLMIFFGLGFKTVVVGLFFYSLLPIIRNTYVGLREVDENISLAGKGVGMTVTQLLLKVQLPLSLPFLLAGVRVAAVIAVGVATLAPFIGGDGLGRDIVAGINTRQADKIYAGAIIAASLAIFADITIGRVQKRLET
ncbi:ABC transporter permease [Ornithinibacillus halophilus]|uniref:Osmoprotectant transport system permease protein n=1 Tax=Ornithinibacillus halophilus TaxID=930117 RepID=A0A1M5MYD2_9BACI|nr:ABC transporter permease [Ornithinibacillus halophilus]SHG81743.1 osmoprotectant transport system permease protein [Ornithinibacillus halophilus]